jgi:hypothetical protein
MRNGRVLFVSCLTIKFLNTNISQPSYEDLVQIANQKRK